MGSPLHRGDHLVACTIALLLVLGALEVRPCTGERRTAKRHSRAVQRGGAPSYVVAPHVDMNWLPKHLDPFARDTLNLQQPDSSDANPVDYVKQCPPGQIAMVTSGLSGHQCQPLPPQPQEVFLYPPTDTMWKNVADENRVLPEMMTPAQLPNMAQAAVPVFPPKKKPYHGYGRPS